MKINVDLELMALKLPTVKNLLRNRGISVHRVPRPSEISEKRGNDTKGSVVELVGPSGVGKSTIFKHIRPILKKKWFFEYHTRVTGLVGHPDADTHAFLKSIYRSRMELIGGSDLDLFTGTSIIKRMSEIVQMEIIARSENFPRGFVFDEGVSHFFADQILDIGEVEKRKMFTGRHFIFMLPSSPETRAVQF